MNINQVAMGCKPDPTNFSIVHLEIVNGYTIVIANYGGKTFDGNKLMVLRGEYEVFDTLDPHFLNKEYPVFARFQPTEEGLILARSLCESMPVTLVEQSIIKRSLPNVFGKIIEQKMSENLDITKICDLW